MREACYADVQIVSNLNKTQRTCTKWRLC